MLYDVEDRRSLDGGLAGGPVRTASVNVRTQPDTELEASRVQAIRVLVAASIAGLSAERVAVTDLRSGLHYAGPLEAATPASAEAEAAAADPRLARQIAHERHLAAKVRQSLAFVKGAVVNVTVAFPAPETIVATAEPPRLREPPLPWRQRAADANAPAEIGPRPEGRPEQRDESPPAAAARPQTGHEGPESILVSIAVPDSYFQHAARAAADRDPAGAGADFERREEQRLREHVLQLLPATPLPDNRKVMITAFPAASTRSARRDDPAAQAASRQAAASRAAEAGRTEPPRTPGQLIDAAWVALAEGRPGDVPREIWLVAIGICSGLLAWLVLRSGADGRRSDRPRDTPRRRGHPRIDWSAIDDAAAAGGERSPSDADTFERSSRKVAA